MEPRKVVAAVRRVACRQDGRITWAQLRSAGAAPHQVAQWKATGWLVPVHAGVYTVGAVPESRSGRFRGALLTHGDDAALSFRAAGGQWEVLGGAVPVEVTVPRRCGRAHRDGVRVHRADLRPEDIAIYKGLRVTSLGRTHLDLASVLPPPSLARVFEQAQVKHHLDPTPLAADVVSWRGRRGIRALRAVIDDAVDPAAVRSVLELRFLKLCDAHGIRRPLVNERFGPWLLDFTWPFAMLVVETDGWAFHRTAAQRRKDAERDAWLRARGFTVVRLTWRDVTEHPAVTVARLRAALAE